MKHLCSKISIYWSLYSFLNISKFGTLWGIVHIGLPVDWKGDSSGQRWVDKFKMAEYDSSHSSNPEELWLR